MRTTDLLLRLPISAKSKIDAAKIPPQVQFEEWRRISHGQQAARAGIRRGMSQLFCSCCCWSPPTLDDAEDRYVDDYCEQMVMPSNSTLIVPLIS
ncbi:MULTISPECIES: hypothetical protein [Bradyrhizobium]